MSNHETKQAPQTRGHQSVCAFLSQSRLVLPTTDMRSSARIGVGIRDGHHALFLAPTPMEVAPSCAHDASRDARSSSSCSSSCSSCSSSSSSGCSSSGGGSCRRNNGAWFVVHTRCVCCRASPHTLLVHRTCILHLMLRTCNMLQRPLARALPML